MLYTKGPKKYEPADENTILSAAIAILARRHEDLLVVQVVEALLKNQDEESHSQLMLRSGGE